MKKIMAFLLAGILILSLFACSGTPMNEAAPSQGASQDTEAEAPAEAPLEAGEVAIQAPQNGQKLVYHAEYTLESRDFDADRQAILAAVKEQGGYVSLEQNTGRKPAQYGENGQNTQIEARIPSENYEAFCAKLEAVGEILHKNSSVEDISEEYYDTESRISFLELRYAKLEEHLKQAEKMEDIITLEKEMAQILTDLDILKGEKRHMENQVQYSTISIYLAENASAGLPAGNGDVGNRASDAFSGTMKGMGAFFEDAAVALAGAAPVLLLLVGIAGITLAIVLPLQRRKKRKQKKNLDS